MVVIISNGPGGGGGSTRNELVSDDDRFMLGLGGAVWPGIRPSSVGCRGKNTGIRSKSPGEETLARLVGFSDPDNLAEIQGWNPFPAENNVCTKTESIV